MHVSVTQLLVILAIVLVVFGTKRLRNVGGDLGGAIKSFRQAMKDGEESAGDSKEKIIDGEVSPKKKEEV
jgi:sec-independent protein translocase protein TatA